jgi:hypothetical protein
MPIECVDVVQAVTSARFGPFIPKWIETWPAAALMMLPGMKNGEILRGVRDSSHLAVVSSIVLRPPIPAPIATPIRGAFASVLDRLHRGCEPEGHERIELAHVLRRHVVLGVEADDLAPDVHREGAGVESRKGYDAAAAVADGVPGGRDVAAQR